MSFQNRPKIEHISTGIANLDLILGGGIPKNSIVVFAGPPGSGKTILSQQIGFHNASKGKKILYIQTLSEPTVKTLLYLQQFEYYDEDKLHESVVFVDLGAILKADGLEAASKMILEQVKKERPELTVIDSFRVFDDLAGSNKELRKFTYQLLVSLIAWESTILLLGEFSSEDIKTNPLFSVVDGIVSVGQEDVTGEQLRYIQVSKLRGSAHNLEKHLFKVSSKGIEVYAPKMTLQRYSQSPADDDPRRGRARVKTGIGVLDALVKPGLLRGTTVLVSGRSGSGKTILLLEFLYRGAMAAGEKGLFVTFQETKENLVTTAHEMGWDLEPLLANGTLEIFSIPQPEVQIDASLLAIQDELRQQKFQRLVIDSISSFLAKISNPQHYREKFYQITKIVQNAEAVCLMSSVEVNTLQRALPFPEAETLVDGSIILHVKESALKRQRYLEVRKLRKTAHDLDVHPFSIKAGGIVGAGSAADDDQSALGDDA